jgi:hypothetical protein
MQAKEGSVNPYRAKNQSFLWKDQINSAPRIQMADDYGQLPFQQQTFAKVSFKPG